MPGTFCNFLTSPSILRSKPRFWLTSFLFSNFSSEACNPHRVASFAQVNFVTTPLAAVSEG